MNVVEYIHWQHKHPHVVEFHLKALSEQLNRNSSIKYKQKYDDQTVFSDRDFKYGLKSSIKILVSHVQNTNQCLPKFYKTSYQFEFVIVYFARHAFYDII